MIRLFIAVFWLLLSVAAVSGSEKTPYRILAFGDSLTAGYGLPASEAFPARLQSRLLAQGYNVVVENAGVSGDTTAGGLSRLDWSLQSDPDLVILELGANDALRGLPPAQAESNLEAMIQRIKAAGAEVLLAGMMAPRNYGDEYSRNFDAIYPKLARKHGVALYPFFLDGVAGEPQLNQSDGLHPTSQGVERIVDGILPVLTPLLPPS